MRFPSPGRLCGPTPLMLALPSNIHDDKSVGMIGKMANATDRASGWGGSSQLMVRCNLGWLVVRIPYRFSSGALTTSCLYEQIHHQPTTTILIQIDRFHP